MGCLCVEESLERIVRNETQLANEKIGLIASLESLTARNEELLVHQKEMSKKYEQDQEAQSARITGLEKENGILKQHLEGQGERICRLERELALWKAAFPSKRKGLIYQKCRFLLSFTGQEALWL